MAIQVNLDVMLARRKMTLSELASKVDITLANFTVTDERKEKVYFAKPYMKGTRHPLQHAGQAVPGAGLPARGSAGLCAGGDGNMTKAPRQGKNTRVATHCYA